MITDTTTDEIYEKLSKLLSDTVPDFELRLKAEIAAEINRLKVVKNAVILGHNYMEPALFHSIPDFVGDGSVEPGRALDCQPLSEGPWYVIECEPADMSQIWLATAAKIAENAPISVRQAKKSIDRATELFRGGDTEPAARPLNHPEGAPKTRLRRGGRLARGWEDAKSTARSATCSVWPPPAGGWPTRRSLLRTLVIPSKRKPGGRDVERGWRELGGRPGADPAPE